MARQLYTRGTIHKIHPSGRIVYEGQVSILGFQTLCANNVGTYGLVQLTAEFTELI